MNARHLRLIVLVAGLAAAALVLGAWTQPWFQLLLSGGGDLAVLGQDATPALSGIALAAIALVAALMIARPWLRMALGFVQVALGGLAVALVAPLVISTDAAMNSAVPSITATTGISGQGATEAIQNFSATGWPIGALLGSVLMATAGLAVILTSRRWPLPTAKYDTVAAADDTTTGAWDALSEGGDPTAC